MELTQQDRILSILEISPRTVSMLEGRTGIANRRVRKALADLKAAGKIYVFRYEIIDGRYVPYYASGNTSDALMPASVASRIATRMASDAKRAALAGRFQNVERPTKSTTRPKPPVFDPSKPVACYGIWGLL